MFFQNLKVWRRSKALAVRTYLLIKKHPLKSDFSFRDQIQRSAISIPSNIAEGYNRDTEKDRIHFLTITKGSVGELWTQLQIAAEVELLPESEVEEMCQELEEIQKMLHGLIKAFRSK